MRTKSSRSRGLLQENSLPVVVVTGQFGSGRSWRRNMTLIVLLSKHVILRTSRGCYGIPSKTCVSLQVMTIPFDFIRRRETTGIICCLEGHESTVWGISFNQDGSRLASCSDDKTVRVWAAQDQQFLSWKLVCTLSGFNDRPIYDVSWSKGSINLLATCSGDNTINIFKQDSYSGDQLTCMTQVCKASHDSDVNTIEFNSVEERLVASGSDDGTVKVWMVKEFD